jgi:hypothetical protein
MLLITSFGQEKFQQNDKVKESLDGGRRTGGFTRGQWCNYPGIEPFPWAEVFATRARSVSGPKHGEGKARLQRPELV